MSQINLQTLPIYNKDTPELSGLYLGLFHGRDDPEKDLNDWGSNGPIIGPLNYVHTTYATHIKLDFVNASDIKRYGFNPDEMLCLDIEDGMVKLGDHWYGDWTVYYHQMKD